MKTHRLPFPRLVASQRLALTLVGSVLFPALAFADEPGGYLRGEPLHQKACYRLDRSPARTSRMVSGGRSEVDIDRLVSLPRNGTGYDSSLYLSFSAPLIGPQKGRLVITVPAEYFTRGFLPKLRQTKRYASRDFKMEHLGIATVTTLDGVTYANTDFIHVYDVSNARYTDLSRALLAMADGTYAENVRDAALDVPVQKIEIWGYFKEGVPALGAAKINIRGVMYGVRIQAGLDVTQDSGACVL